MSLLPLKIRPGIFKNGTEYEAKGRWNNGQLFRFFEGAKRPVGGWSELQVSSADFEFKAVGALTLTHNPLDTETVTLDARVYTFQTVLTDVDGNVLIGTDAKDSLANLVAAITLGAGSGTKYAASTTLHATVTATAAPGGVRTLTLDANAGDTETVVIGAKTYTFQTTLTDVDGNVLIGAAATDSIDNLIAAITLGAGAGTLYATSMTAHLTITTAKVGAGDTMDSIGEASTSETLASGEWGAAMYVEAKTAGSAGVVATTETLTDGSFAAVTTLEHACRALIGYLDNTSSAARLGIGTNSKVFSFTQGAITDITPEGLVVGTVDASTSVGAYGQGAYGVLNYGEGDPSQEVIIEASAWQLDTFGDFLVGVLHGDGRLFFWDGTAPSMEEMTNAPVDNDAVVVTGERFVVALGAGGDPRKIQWADQESLTVWGATSLNQAGSIILPGTGVIMSGIRGRNETLVFTSEGLHAMQFIGGTLVYSIREVGRHCGVISRNAATFVNGIAVWMGQNSFYLYDGFVKPLPSDVGDYVFGDFNRTESGKVFSFSVSDFSEAWWLYCSGSSSEPDRYVVWNYKENHWSIGILTRTAGIDRGALAFPMMSDLTNIFDHERGSTRSGATAPFLDSGPVELGNGERVQDITQLVPDEATQAGQVLGSLQARLFHRLYPTATETEAGPFTLANPTDVRITARQVRVRVEELVAGDWRLGLLRLQTRPGSMR